MHDEVQESQQAPESDSGLQTPQPDQRMPTEQERFDQSQKAESIRQPDDVVKESRVEETREVAPAATDSE